jgi:hypothetical protein
MGATCRNLATWLVLVVVSGLCVRAVHPSSESETSSITAGGTLTWSFNPGVLGPLSIRVDSGGSATHPIVDSHLSFGSQIATTSGLYVTRRGERIVGFDGGILELRDGPRLEGAGGAIDWRQARIKPQTPTLALTVTDRNGAEWATLDRPHFGVSDDGHRFLLREFNLRIGSAMAASLGDVRLIGEIIGSVDLDLPIIRVHEVEEGMEQQRCTCSASWPTSQNPVKLQMLFLDHDPELGGLADSVSVMRCGIPTASGEYLPCTRGSRNGLVVIASDAAVQNVGDTAIAWRPMFSKPAEPYGNDQHPFLYWNLYRFDPDGSIRQIGASGVKHAYFPDNFGCNCPSALVSFPQCKETYAAGTNDVANVFGPRGEIIPNKGIWGRCGSVFDGSCDGVRDPAYPPKDDGYAYRLAVREEDLLPMLHPKARYVFEYAYVIRDQANPELSMAHRTLRPSKVPTASGVRWSTAAIDFDQGPAINAWISPIKPSARAANQRISTPYGAFRVAASVTALTKGLFRYDYALLNEDFAIASTTGQEPNLRIADSRGLDRIEVHIRSKDISPVQTSVAFGNNAPSVWAVDAHPNLVAWTAPEHHSLGWGMLVSFSLVTKSAPSAGEILICSGSTGSGTATYKIMMPAP